MKLLITISYIIFLFFFINTGFSQTTEITSVLGSVVNSKQYPIPYSTILFLNKDSIIKYGGICDSMGLFELETVKNGSYIVKTSSIGYLNEFTTVNINTEKKKTYLRAIMLKTDINQLEEIEINANKTGYTSYVDKTVFFPDSLALKTSKNALDLLNKVPEVKVNKKNDAIKVLGNSNVLVLIDGVHTNRVLKAITPDEIKNIEIITHPSAKYRSDIESVINIVLKDEKKAGISIYSDISLCLHQKNHLAFTQISYTYKKFRVFLNYNAYSAKYINRDTTTRTENPYKYHTYSLNDPSYDFNNQSFQYGFDFIPNKSLLVNFTGKLHLINTINTYQSRTIHTHNDTVLLDDMLSDNHSVDGNAQHNYSLYIKKVINKKHTFSQTTNLYFLNQKDYTTLENKNNQVGQVSETNSQEILSFFNQYSINSKLDYSFLITKKNNLDLGYQFYSRGIENKIEDDINTTILNKDIF
jgi:hypothetical protein